MAKNNELTPVVLITRNPKLVKEIQQDLDEGSGFSLVKHFNQLDNIVGLVQAARPSIILVDYQVDEDVASLKVIDDITSSYFTGAVVCILPEAKLQSSDRVILAGARAILWSPFPKENLLTTLRRVRELLFRNLGIVETPAPAAAPATQSRSYVVYSPKGGVGCTTVAINLAIALQQQLNEKVLLVDGRHILGHVALMLNLRTGNSITDLLLHADKLDESLVRQVVVEHVSGISILAGPTSIERGQDINPEALFKVFQVLKAVYPNIIVDGGSYLDDNLVTYMDMTDNILLVVNPNLASLRDVRQFLNFSRSLSYSEEKILLVLNQAGHKSDVKLPEIEKVLHSRLIGTIPADEDMMLSCLNEGVPVMQKKAGHPISKAFKALAKTLATTFVSARGRNAANASQSADILRKSSYLG